MVVTDRDGIIVYVNNQVEHVFGYARAELVGKPVETLMPARFREGHAGHRSGFMRHAQSRPMGTGLELFGQRKDGVEFPVEISLSPIETPEGLLVSAAIRDISQRRAAERELDRLRRLQEQLLASVAEGVLGVEPDGTISFVNAAGARMLGYRPEELVGKREHEVIHRSRPDGAPYALAQCPIHRSCHDGTVHHASGEVFWRQDGRGIPVEYTSAPVREHGNLVGAAVIFTDVTERQLADEVARRANQRLLHIYESIPEAFFALDRDWRLLYMNPVAERMRQTPKERVLGKTIWEAFPDLVGTRFEAEYRRAMKERRPVTVEEFYPATSLWFEATAYPSEEGLSIYFRDVTGRRRAEDEAKAANIARPLARKIVQDLVETGGVAHQILQQVGRNLAMDAGGASLEDFLSSFTDMGLGHLELERSDGPRYAFTGTDLLEKRPGSRVATCNFTLGYLSEAVSHIHAHDPTLGTEIECQSRGAPRCRFIVQARKSEEGLARRVKELI